MIHPYVQRSRAVPGVDQPAGTGRGDVATVQSVELVELPALAQKALVQPQAMPAFQQLLDEPEEEVTLAPRTLLVIEGFNEALRVRVDGVTPLSSGDQFTVRPGTRRLEVDRLALDGSVAETRAGTVTFRVGTLSRVRFRDLAPVGAWSTQKKVAVALVAALAVGGVVYVVASKR